MKINVFMNEMIAFNTGKKFNWSKKYAVVLNLNFI